MRSRKPMAISNWKMAMTVEAGRDFVREFTEQAGAWLDAIDVVLCPPFTALWAVAQRIPDGPLQLAGQNVAPTNDTSRMGEISAPLLVDVGCRWVLLGHWAVRRNLGEDDALLERKVGRAFEAGLTPILLLGEGRDETEPLEEVVAGRLSRILGGCAAEDVADMAFVYEPEGAIGADGPTATRHATRGARAIRGWLAERWDDDVAESVRIIYGGSVTPEHAAALLASPALDGLGASRKGRDPVAFARIVRRIAEVKDG